MSVIETGRDVIVHEQPNGDLWIYQRDGLPSFVRKEQPTVFKVRTRKRKPSAKTSRIAKKS